MSVPALFKEEPAKLIVNRRAIAAGLAALIGAPTVAVAQLKQITNVSMSFNPDDFAIEMQDGIFLPDYRYPMVRIVFENGETTRWHKYRNTFLKQDESGRYKQHVVGADRPGNRAVAIECCAPDKNGSPRYSQLAIG